MRRLGFFLMMMLGACAPGRSQGAEPGEAKVLRVEPPPPPSAGQPPVADPSWADAIREERWRDAAELLDRALARAATPEARYARAWVAAALGQSAQVLELLSELETALPILREEIAGLRARAQLEVGPYAEAAAYWAARGDAASLLDAALAWERGGKPDQAAAFVERALSGIRKLKSARQRQGLEARARVLRARLALGRKNEALALTDLRWLAITAPTSPEAEVLEEQYAELVPRLNLTEKERYERAWSMAERGWVDDTERELARLGRGSKLHEADALRARGWALYRSRDDDQRAAALLQQAAKLGSRDVPHDLYYAGRALARARASERAIELYDDVARRFPTSGYAEQARYLAARTAYVTGAWEEAVRRYQAYLARYAKRGKHTDSARYELAVAELSSGRFDGARQGLTKLVDQARHEREKVALQELLAVALAGAGQRERAVELFGEVIATQPLSFHALVSRERLIQLAAPVPPLIAPAEAGAPPEPLRVVMPEKARLLSALGLDADAERVLIAHEPALRKAAGDRAGEALCTLYGELFGAARRYRIGQERVRAAALDIAPSPRTRWAWDCIYPRPYAQLVDQAEAEWQLPRHLVYAVMRQESSFRADVVSPASAVGLMQLMPSTAARVAGELGTEISVAELDSPARNVRLGGYYLGRVLGWFQGHVPLAVASYNAGPPIVGHWLASGASLPLDVFVARIPYRETREYVARVVGNWARYLYLNGGEAAVPRLDLALPQGIQVPEDAY